ncbi:HAD-IC family P-type ATPase (plasmid) [Legionella lytica]|uniref:HAD-IC family P-type ATPase n=1 Tax=Legionella lytica TaxID=96232 RepID=A0ABY4YD27_9GAMM|nr:HAD-IC family P-type ATPase [Legionella lytica]USQ15436.1 HAD-IC family P-type ATPase [Legionella lytica]
MIKGLLSSEVEERIKQGKQNVATATKTKKIAEIFIENIFSVFNLVIFAIIIFLTVFFFIEHDERLFFDIIGVSFIVIINTFIAIFEEIKAKRALDKVNLLLTREVTVIRDGTEQSIEQSEVVIDDIILLERGDSVVVDGVIVESTKLEIDESLLTGESTPINKNVNDELMSGSHCLSGRGVYKALKVGDECHAQEITKLAKKFKLNISPLQKRLNFIVKILFAVALVLIALEMAFGQAESNRVELIRKMATVMLALVPQGLILMASVTFALGIYRISKMGAIIQKLNAIEAFSNTKIVCTDKTGTLTQNKLSVHKITPLSTDYSMEEIKQILGTYARFSLDKNATLRTLEPFNASNAIITGEIPFTSENKFSLLQLIVHDDKLHLLNNKKVTFVLGGYDVLLDKIDDAEKNQIDELYQKGKLKVFRNLIFGIEKSNFSPESLAENTNCMEIEPICIISIMDQVREDVMDAINLFQRKNIQVKILSGDNASSIQAVAHEIGWKIQDSDLISGNEIDAVNDEQLLTIIKDKKIFSRLKPQHKLRIVKLLRENKIYTAMIGDGVNDLPAIKEADIGIAMEEGSSITKEVADIVLLKNKFTLLPKIFDEGNKIVNTINDVAKLFLTKTFLVIFTTLMSFFAFYDFPLTPRRVALINIFSIGLPSFIIALKNSNINKLKNFTTELFSFVMISALLIAIASYVGQCITEQYAGHTAEDLQMVMLSIMVIVTTTNFLAVTIHKKEKNLRLYFLYAFGLIALYSSLALSKSDFILVKWAKIFYEISYLDRKYWLLTFLISFVFSIAIILSQLLRKKILKSITR